MAVTENISFFAVLGDIQAADFLVIRHSQSHDRPRENQAALQPVGIGGGRPMSAHEKALGLSVLGYNRAGVGCRSWVTT